MEERAELSPLRIPESSLLSEMLMLNLASFSLEWLDYNGLLLELV